MRINRKVTFDRFGAEGMHMWCGGYAPHVRRVNTIAIYGWGWISCALSALKRRAIWSFV